MLLASLKTIPPQLISSYFTVIIWSQCCALLKPKDTLSFTPVQILVLNFKYSLFIFSVLPQAHCYYHGEVEGHINSDVSISTCTGVK